jgi:hypothetical protein
MRLGLHDWTYSTPPDPAEIATMPDRHPVEIAEQLAEKVLPRLADVGGHL